MPLSGSVINLEILLPKDLTRSIVPSVEPPSTIIYSTDEYFWAKTDLIVSAMVEQLLNETVMTDTEISSN